MATPQRDACTIEGQIRDVLLNGDTENYNGEQGYTTHTITRENNKGITVELNHPYIINCVRMLLWDRDNRSDTAARVWEGVRHCCTCEGGGQTLLHV